MSLESLGLVHSEFDHAVFVYKRLWNGEEVHCLLAMHVDDSLYTKRRVMRTMEEVTCATMRDDVRKRRKRMLEC